MTYLLSPEPGTMEAPAGTTTTQPVLLGNRTTVSSATPVSVIDLPASRITAITAGPSTSTALLANGEVWDWGNNVYGQLGDGSKMKSDVPVEAKLLGRPPRSTPAATR